MDEGLSVEFQGYSCLITINRPEQMNALNFPTLKELQKLINDLRFNTSLRTVIITGAGTKAFSAGADLKERAGLTHIQVKEFLGTIRSTLTAIENLQVPVIAAINGLALGGGAELALACDIRIASETATIGLTEVSLGIIPGAGGTQRLTRLVGKGVAKEIIFTGRKLNAHEAFELGLVNKLVSSVSATVAAQEMAALINNNAPIAVQQAKFAINHGSEVDLETGLNIEAKAYEICLPTKDRLEGLAAFKEKRKPQYRGE
ncbi:MAG: enoyl-CoA hydratase/isomerase family protein [Dethiobacter sp.]|jgi:enoyl-CoA hydratase/carnithine racemase|nr:enoyl-CoA hydratase/isomerase family protein [Dethiobacter sp.]MBS3901411.1 enoyl-CoA hydratase/isomerase family protein [Dethiobacter sp.]MBS3988655.1 enoyl-CoA hydratase/isomerase family protein [Dethiobacter sp.]